MLQPVDYLAIGHIAEDVTPAGIVLGGSVSYAALTALQFGLRVGIVTSAGASAPLAALSGVQIFNVPAEYSTTFENVKTPQGRKQTLHHQAAFLTKEHVPQEWRAASIVHLAPIAREVDASLVDLFPNSLIGITPQGWMRGWDENGSVFATAWGNNEHALTKAGAVVMSLEDVNHSLEMVESLAHHTKIYCLTDGAEGAVMHWHGDRRRFRPPQVDEVDATGAGDIFAAGLFIRLFQTKDPWEAARFATNLAAYSVTRPGLDGIPTIKEIEYSKLEVLS